MRTSTRWIPVVVVIFIALSYATAQLEWLDYAYSWVGNCFEALSGGAIGWAVSRYVCRLDLSQFPPEHRALPGLAQAILIAGFANAVAGF
jgi:hypothetical protein